MADSRPTELGIEGLGSAVRIGSGGFADVYRAEQLNLRRQVAVKVLRGTSSDAQSKLRFDRECQALGAVSNHPHIVGVHRSGFTDDGRAYLIMEFCPGGSLLDGLKADGVMAAAEVIDVGVKIGKALAVAHDAGVLHRDVKPANILVTAYGEPALADFGIARVEGADQTATGQITASFTHAAPEVLKGQPPSTKSDVYSLGSTLFELRTGSPGHVRTGDESAWMLIRRATSEPFPDPGVSGIGDPLARVIRKATSADPGQRYDSVDDLVSDLGRASAPAADAVNASTVDVGATQVAASAVPPPGPHPQPQHLLATSAAPASSAPTGVDLGATVNRPVATGFAPPPGPIEVQSGSRRRGPLVAAILLVMALIGAGIGFAVVSGRTAVPPVTLAFPQGQEGPLDVGDTYELDIAGGDEDTVFEVLLDGRAVDEPTVLPLTLTPDSGGRHALVIRSTRGDNVAATDAIELYVIGELPAPGYRANLVSVTDDPGNWATAIARFDELVEAGHTDLELLPSSRFPALRPGFWNLFVPGFGDDKPAGEEYCESFDLAVPDECFVTEFIPEP